MDQSGLSYKVLMHKYGQDEGRNVCLEVVNHRCGGEIYNIFVENRMVGTRIGFHNLVRVVGDSKSTSFQKYKWGNFVNQIL